MAERQFLSDVSAGDVLAREVSFVLETWRQAALGNANCPRLLREFRKHCGAETESVFEIYFAFLRALGRASRRRLKIGHPGCPGMTRDELQVLSLLAAAQTGHWTLFDAHLCWLASDGSRAVIAGAATVLADTLAKRCIDISGRLHIEQRLKGVIPGLSLVRMSH
jgi:hypothetical protein